MNFFGNSQRSFQDTYSYLFENKLILLNNFKARELWNYASKCGKKNLNMLEIGAYKGGSSILMSLAYGQGFANKQIIVDPFIGHLSKSISNLDDTRHHYEGHFGDTSMQLIKNNYEKLNLQVPAIKAMAIEDCKFENTFLENLSLIHLDTDLYLPTKYVFENLTPRCPKGLVIIVDDFKARKTPGIEKAVLELRESDYIFREKVKEQIIVIKK